VINKLTFKYGSLLNTVGPIAIINIILALIALLKDMFLASYLGTNKIADAFTLAFFITDMIGNNMIANALGNASIPVFSKIYVKQDYKLLHKCVIKVIVYLMISTFFLSVLMFVFRTEIINLIGTGFTDEGTKLCAKLFIILLPTMIFYPIMLIFISYLQVHGKYIISSLMPVLFNLIFFIGLVYCSFKKIDSLNGTYIISYSIVIALMSILFLMFLYIKNINAKEDFSVELKFPKEESYNINSLAVEIINLTIPYLLIIVFSQGMLYFERSIASNISDGSVSALNYAYRLSQFPIWVFVVAISTVFFPSISKLIHSKNEEKAKDGLLKVVFFTVTLVFPIMLTLFILKRPIIAMLFLRGSFDSKSLSITVEIFSTYCFVIIGQSLSNICIKYFLAIKEVKTPVKILCITFIINIFIDIYGSKYIGLYALGLGAAVGSFLSAVLILKNLKLDFIKKYSSKLIYIIFANLILSCVLLIGLILYNYSFLNENVVIQFLFIAITVFISFMIFIFILYKKKVF